MNWLKFELGLRERGFRLFSPSDVQHVLKVSPIAVRFLLHRYSAQGALLKLRNGLYAFAQQLPSAMVIANRLYEPSYLSLEFALAYYHVMPETVYRITSVTSRPTRIITTAGTTFEYHRIKRSAFTGYEPAKVGIETVLLAMPEKALVDYLYFVDLHKTVLNERLTLRGLSRRVIMRYARLFERASLERLARGLR